LLFSICWSIIADATRHHDLTGKGGNMVARTVRWGIISTARIAQRAVIPAIQDSRNGTVVAIASRSLPQAQEVARNLGIPRAYGSYEELLADPEVDAVYNPLPNSLHKEWTIRAAEGGKHVLCEKPLALNAAECDEMIRACEAHGVRFMEAFMYRFHPQITRLKELLSSGIIGPLQLIRASFSFRLSDLTNIRLRKDLGGGALMDVGCYTVNFSRLMAGAEPVEVQAVAHFGDQSGVDETLVGVLRFPAGEIAQVDCSFRAPFRQFCELVGQDGVIQVPAPWLPGTADATIIVRRDDETQTIAVPGANHYQLMVEHFAECVLTGREPRYPASEGRDNMRVIDALYESARGGRPVRLDDL